MATLTIRRLDEEVKEALRVRAAQAGRSMEDEARTILTRAIQGMRGPEVLQRASILFGDEHGVRPEESLFESSRDTGRTSVHFEKDEN